MSNDIFVITEHMDGKFSDVSFELVGKAKELAKAWAGRQLRSWSEAESHPTCSRPIRRSTLTTRR